MLTTLLQRKPGMEQTFHKGRNSSEKSFQLGAHYLLKQTCPCRFHSGTRYTSFGGVQVLFSVAWILEFVPSSSQWGGGRREE